jgi:ectoine hydroxylase-related dioxygenase (phytanoyl-CoA dioxygenase family)
MNTTQTDQHLEPWVEEYRTRGYVKLPGVFSGQEMDIVRDEFDRVFDDPDVVRADSLRTTSRPSTLSGTVMDRLDPITDVSPLIKKLTQDPRIVDAVAAAFGEPALLFKDKAIMKPPGAYGYGLHQDFTNWQELPVPPQFLISVLVAIDSGTRENGGFQAYPGLHEQHLRPPEKPSDIFGPDAGLLEEEVLGGVPPELIEVQPGDLVLFSSLAPHRSGPNESQRKRRTLFLSYSAARFGDVYDLYYRNFFGYLAKDRDQM